MQRRRPARRHLDRDDWEVIRELLLTLALAVAIVVAVFVVIGMQG